MRRPSPATAIALLALFVALGGPAQAAKLVSGSTIRANTITTKQVKAGSLSLTDLTKASQASLRRTGARSITAAELKDGAVGRADLAADAVDASRVLDGSIGALDLASGSIFAEELAPGAVGGAALVTEGVGSRALASGSVGGDELVDGGVGPKDIADGVLAAADLGRFAGTLGALNFQTIAPGACATVTTLALAPVAGGQDLRDDAIVVTPSPTFPAAGMSVSAKANPDAGDRVDVTVCNVGNAGPVTVNDQDFRFVSFDAG